MSPRKSSTSSGSPVHRPRYLGIEVAGGLAPPRSWLEPALARALPSGPIGGALPRVRVIRVERSRALVEVGHRWASEARRAWNGSLPGPAGRPIDLATRRTWGTMRGGKLWLRELTGRKNQSEGPSRS